MQPARAGRFLSGILIVIGASARLTIRYRMNATPKKSRRNARYTHAFAAWISIAQCSSCNRLATLGPMGWAGSLNGSRVVLGSGGNLRGGPIRGRGPYCEEYFHMGGDEELKCVAENLGVYWARPDLTHFHQWFGRDGDQHQGVTVPIPAYMARAYGPEEWAHFQRVFTERKAAGFPGSELL